MPTMNVNLSEDLAEFVGEQTREGGYTNQSEVVREGLRLLRSRLVQRQALLKALKVGREASEAGQVRPLTRELLRDIGSRGQRLAKKGTRKKH